MTVLLQASLTGGELPPSLYGMVDLAWYKNCLKTCRNFVVQPYGGIKNRSGSRYITELKTSTTKARLIPFSFSTTQNYVLEFGNLYVRIIANGVLQTYGATPPSAWVTATTYLTGSYVRNGGIDYYCLFDHTSAATFAADLASVYWYALAQSASTGAILEMPTDYLESELQKLKFTQSADVLTVVHPNHPPMQLSRYSATKWTFLEQSLNKGPFQNVNTDTGVSVWASANEGTVTISSSGPLFYAKHVGMLFYVEQKDFGVSWLPGVVKAVNDIVRSGGNYYIARNAGTTGQNIPIGTSDNWNDGGVSWGYVHNGFGVARITGVTNSTTATAYVLSRIPDGTSTAGFIAAINVASSAVGADGTITITLNHSLTAGTSGVGLVNISMRDLPAIDVTMSYTVLTTGATGTIKLYPKSLVSIHKFSPPSGGANSASYKWAFGAFGDPALGDATNGFGPGYPGAVTYFQQRLCFAGSNSSPDTVWTSKTANYSDFGTSFPILDDDSVVYTLAGNQVNAIKSLLQLDKLLVLTNGSVWATGSGQQTDVLSPGNIGVKLQGYTGVSELPPLGIGGSALYVQEKGQVVRDLNYQWANDAYTGQNLTARGSHLTDGHYLTEWTFQQSPTSCVWMVREDGTLLGLTYLREQEVAAWHRHDTDGLYESVCCVSEGQEDVLYVIVRRTINGAVKRYVERFETRLVTDIRDAFFVDCGVTYDNRNTSATTITLSGGTLYDSTELITLTASASTFQYPATTDVDDQIVLEDADGVPYQITITSTTSTTVATGRPISAVPVAQRSATANWSWARNTLGSLGHLEGKEVAILADGLVQDRKTVTAGVVTLDYPAVRVQIGIPYDSDAETLALAPATPETIRGNFKMVSVLRAILQESRSLWAGPSATKLFEAKTRTVADGFTTPPNLISDVVEIRLNSTWDRNGTTLIRHSDPTPIGVLALMPEVTVGGS